MTEKESKPKLGRPATKKRLRADGKEMYYKKVGYYDIQSNKYCRKDFWADTVAELNASIKKFNEDLEIRRNEYEKEKNSKPETSVEYMMKEWLKKYKQKKSNTIAGYESKLKTWVFPNIGKMQVIDVKMDDIQNIFYLMSKAKNRNGGIGLSQQSKKHVDILLKSFFNNLVDRDIIVKNPCRAIEEQKVEPPIVETFTYDEMREIQHESLAALGSVYHVYFFIAASTGMRASEISGLAWENIDIKKRYIYIRRSVIGTNLNGKREIEINTKLKTNLSQRTIEIGDDVIAILNYWIQIGVFKKHTDGFTYLFQDLAGVPYHPAKFSKAFSKLIKKLIEQKKIKTEKGLHNCRHYHATQLMMQGVHIEEIAKRLGDLISTVHKYYIEGWQQKQPTDGLGELVQVI